MDIDTDWFSEDIGKVIRRSKCGGMAVFRRDADKRYALVAIPEEEDLKGELFLLQGWIAPRKGEARKVIADLSRRMNGKPLKVREV